jgi:hypothetical protein
MVIGASDRMITAGDIQFEPPRRSKIFALTTSIAVMTAGDAAMQTEVLRDVKADVHRRVMIAPDNWWLVRDVASTFARHYSLARLRRAEAAILAPLGLNAHSFLTEQKHMSPDLVRQLATEMRNFKVPNVSTIFAGVDFEGPHIFVVQGADVSCEDSVGFASIGVGSWHSDSQFMFAGHDVGRPFPATLFLAYSAKKHAEVAPGVGGGTDMFSIGANLGSYFSIGNHVIESLEKIYQNSRKIVEQVVRQAEESTDKYVQEITAPRTAEAQAIPSETITRMPLPEGDEAAHEGAAPEED